MTSFEHLVVWVQDILASRDDDRDPFFVAVQVHTWIHGIVDLCGRHPGAEWPEIDALLDELLIRLGLD